MLDTILDQKLPTLTDRYNLAKTSDIITHVESLGFNMDKFVALKTRKPERKGFQKHRAVFSSDLFGNTRGDRVQLLLTNSHDGSSSVQLQLGFYRMVCANGLVAGEKLTPMIRIKHTQKDLMFTIEREVERLVAYSNNLDAAIDKFKQIILSPLDIKQFNLDAAKIKLGNEVKIESVDFTPRRSEDGGNDLWSVFNVAQENLIRGGSKILLTDENQARKLLTTRAVNSFASSDSINERLFELALQRAA